MTTRQCIYCGTGMKRAPIQLGYHCCNVCWRARGAHPDNCRRGCEAETCGVFTYRLSSSHITEEQKESFEDPLGW